MSIKSKNDSKFTNIDDVKCFVDISDVTHLGPCAKEVILGAAQTDLWSPYVIGQTIYIFML